MLAAVGGYLFRGREFRRDQRLRLYSDFVATFLDAVSAGVGLGSAYFVLGDKIGDADNRERVRPLWEAWERSAPAFTHAAARIRFVASDKLRARAEDLE